ncbi:hypothetical protein HN51_024334 [Arachis hypogaea]
MLNFLLLQLLKQSWFPQISYVVVLHSQTSIEKTQSYCMKSFLQCLHPELLNQILPAIGETARRILSREGCDSNTREIVVNLHVVTRRNIVQDSDIYNDDLCENVPELTQLVNLLERSKIDEQDDDAECAICLEKFGHGNEDSSVDVVRINCSHVFHDRCMLRWLRCCADHQSPYSCPLCRCLISATSHGDDE